jgi:hypothetical protein
VNYGGGMREFIRDYKLMAIRPRAGNTPLLKGRLEFSARNPEVGEIEDAFDLEIDVPRNFPRDLPTVTETGKKIPRTPDYHVNQHDGSLCLGSPLRLLLLVSEKPSLIGFAETCLVPYLFAVWHKLRHGGSLPFGELAHGLPGILVDYMDLFKLEKPEEAFRALQLLGQKKRRANKDQCPCGCKRRLGKCKFNSRMRKFRELSERSWFRQQAQEAEQQLEIYRRHLQRQRVGP